MLALRNFQVVLPSTLLRGALFCFLFMVPLFTVRPDGREPAPGSGAGKHLLRDACAGPLGRLFPTFCQKGPHICAASFTFLCGGHTPVSQDASRALCLPLFPGLPVQFTLRNALIMPWLLRRRQLWTPLLSAASSEPLSCFHFKEVSCQGRCSEVSMFSSFLISPFSKLAYSASLHLLPPCLQAGRTYTDLQEKVKIIKDKWLKFSFFTKKKKKKKKKYKQIFQPKLQEVNK